MAFEIYALPAKPMGELALCPLPGRDGDYAQDLGRILDWQPKLVLSMTESEELQRGGAASLASDLLSAGVAWLHLPIRDFGAPKGETLKDWPTASSQARSVLQDGGRVLAHCFGGQGRSGMALLRLMVETGETPQQALARLRSIRPGAVETDAQFAWAAMAAD